MTLTKFDNPNRHEMVIFEEKPEIGLINKWAINQTKCKRKIFIYDTNSQKIITDHKIKGVIVNTRGLDKYLRISSSNKRKNSIKSVIRQDIWSAIKEKYCGVSFFFNFQPADEYHKNQIKEIEQVLNTTFQKFYGFPLFCSCLHDTTINIIDLLQLMKFHTDIQVFKHEDRKELLWNVSKKPPHPDLSTIAKNFYESDADKISESDLNHIIQRAFSEDNEPFYIREESGETIGVALNLPSLLHQLESAPLDTFCFHCYRISRVDLEGNAIMPVPRSDIPLWIEYSIGDSFLADKIYSTIKKTLGYYGSPKLATIFAKKTTRDSVLNLIRERVNQLALH